MCDKCFMYLFGGCKDNWDGKCEDNCNDNINDNCEDNCNDN